MFGVERIANIEIEVISINCKRIDFSSINLVILQQMCIISGVNNGCDYQLSVLAKIVLSRSVSVTKHIGIGINVPILSEWPL